MNWIDKSFGVQAQAISVLSQRSSVLASNIANSESSGFKARDIDFKSVLASEKVNQKVSLERTNKGHMDTSGGISNTELLYRVPTKNASDGNTVEAEVEQTAFAENAVRYQSSLTFLGGTIAGLKLAIKGGQ